MIPILVRYLAKEIFLGTLVVLFGLLSLFVFIDLIASLKDVSSDGFQLGDVVLYTFYSLPRFINLALPIAALIATLFVVSRMSEQSELAVMRTSGMSLLRLTLVIGVIGSMFAAFIVILNQFVLPYSQEASKQVRAANVSGAGSSSAPKERVVGREFRSGYWLRDGANFVNIAALQANGGLEKVRVYTFDDSNRLRQIIDAASASNTIQNGVSQWQLENVKRTLFLAKDQIQVESVASMPWQVNFGRGLLQTLQTTPEDMSFDQLQNYIEHLKKNNQQSARYESVYLSKLAYPVACVVMMLLALPFAITSSRKGGAGIKILAGIIIGLAFHALGSLFGYASQRGLWPAWVGAFAPTIIFAAAVIGSLRWLERR